MKKRINILLSFVILLLLINTVRAQEEIKPLKLELSNIESFKTLIIDYIRKYNNEDENIKNVFIMGLTNNYDYPFEDSLRIPKYGIYRFGNYNPHAPVHFLFVYKDSMAIIYGKDVSYVILEYDKFMKTNKYKCNTKYNALKEITATLAGNFFYRPKRY